MIHLPTSALEPIRDQARAAYPRECCGALLGWIYEQGNGGFREVVRSVPLPNAWEGRQERRYLIASQTVRELEGQAEREDLELIGFFHSHPDHPAEPSSFDREHAWPWYTYLIIPVDEGVLGPVRAWRLADDRSDFSEEPLAILEEP